jgi:outer membrane protein OmpA-like peptidoglycan-associated protein
MRLSYFRTLLIASLLLAGAPAWGQNKGFQLNRYEPTAAGEWSFAVDHPWYSSLRSLAAGITLNYAHNPLVLESLQPGGTTYSTQSVLIGHQLIGHIDIAGSIANRVLLSFSLPFTLLERGDDATANMYGVNLVSSAAVGDPRFGAMFRVFGNPYESAISLSLGAYVWVPINTKTFPLQTGETNFRFLPKLVLSGIGHHVMWSFTGGFYVRPEASIGNLAPAPGNSVGSELQLGAAIAYASMERRLSIGPEAVMYTDVLNGNAFNLQHTNLEVLLGLNYNIARLIQLGVAGGAGVLRGPGTPDARVLLRLAYAPMADKRPKDRDNDGIPDPEDACPDQAGVRTGNPATNGCPPPPADRDQDGVVDTQDLCPDEPAGAKPDPEKPGCPLRDSDLDGVYDNQDQCPQEPAGAKPDPEKPGCPLRDTDGDGVYDNEDRCKDTPAGPHPSRTAKGCPDKDSDGDGVYDTYDQCPTVAAGLNPDPQKPGCPLPDRDHDQIPDATDACPDKPGSPSPDPKKNGCPGLVEVKSGQIIIKEQVFFATNKDVVLKKSFTLLDVVAHTLNTLPQIKRVMIEGHTDNQGKPELNTDLSDRRAKSVMRYLISKGVAAGRLEAKGFGPTQPIADNKTAKGRALNRRVDFKITDPAQPAPPAGAASPFVAPPMPAAAKPAVAPPAAKGAPANKAKAGARGKPAAAGAPPAATPPPAAPAAAPEAAPAAAKDAAAPATAPGGKPAAKPRKPAAAKGKKGGTASSPAPASGAPAPAATP